MNDDYKQRGRERPAEPQAAANARRVQDRRTREDMYVPRYVMRELSEQLGEHALALYWALAWYCCSDAPTRWPSINELAAKLAVSRSTVERAMRRLRALQLIEVMPCMAPNGQHSNWIYLRDPPSAAGQSGSDGAPFAGAFPETAPPCPNDRGAPSDRQGGAVPETAPSVLIKGSERVCVENATHTPEAAPAQQDFAAAANRITARWIAQLPPGAPGWREAHTAEVAWQAGDLLQRGYTEVELLASIEEVGRDRGEWPRVWAARQGRRKPQAAQRPAVAAKRAQARTEEAAAAAREQEGAAWQRSMQQLRERIHAARPPATVAAIAATEEEGASAAAAAGGEAARPAGGAPPAAAAAEG